MDFGQGTEDGIEISGIDDPVELRSEDPVVRINRTLEARHRSVPRLGGKGIARHAPVYRWMAQWQTAFGLGRRTTAARRCPPYFAFSITVRPPM